MSSINLRFVSWVNIGILVNLGLSSCSPSIKTATYNDEYMKECKLKYPAAYTQQAGFQEMYPGITTKDELIDQLGQPDDYTESNTRDEYLYFDSRAGSVDHFIMKDNLVTGIRVQSDTEILLPLRDILETYGCPDLIFAIAPGDDVEDTPLVFSETFLVYLEAGIRINLDSYPIKYSSNPFQIYFVVPDSVSDYLDWLEQKALKDMILVSFSDAVIDE